MKNTTLYYNTVENVKAGDFGCHIFWQDGSSTFTMNTEVALDFCFGDVVGFDSHGRIWEKLS